MFILAVGNTNYGKRNNSRTGNSVLIAVYLRRKLAFTAIFTGRLPGQLDTFFNPKKPQKRTL